MLQILVSLYYKFIITVTSQLYVRGRSYHSYEVLYAMNTISNTNKI